MTENTLGTLGPKLFTMGHWHSNGNSRPISPKTSTLIVSSRYELSNNGKLKDWNGMNDPDLDPNCLTLW